MTSAEDVETSVTFTNTNSLSQDGTNLGDQLSQTSNDTPMFIPFTLIVTNILTSYKQYIASRSSKVVIKFKYGFENNP